MAKKLRKAEPSRSEAMTPAARSFPHFGSHKLRRLAASGLGEAGAMQHRVALMMRTAADESGAYDAGERPMPNVLAINDVTHGLGLDAADEQRVQKLVDSSVATFTPKTQTQRIMHARGRVVSTMRDSMKHIDADTRGEISRRAMAYWKRNTQTDYGKAPTIRFEGSRPQPVMQKAALPVITFGELSKGMPRGGKYYRRIPTGNPEHPWRYFYHEDEYKKYLQSKHLHGPAVSDGKKKPEQTGFDFSAPPESRQPEPQLTVPASRPAHADTKPDYSPALQRTKHLGNSDAAEHLQITHDGLRFRDALEIVVKHRYGVGLDAYQKKRMSGESLERIDGEAKGPTPPKSEPKTPLEDAPPGGWKDSDRVDSKAEQARIEAAKRRREELDDVRATHLSKEYRKGDELTIDGKKWKVVRAEQDIASGRYGRSILIEPGEGNRAREPRDLRIRPDGSADMGSPAVRVERIIGGHDRDMPWRPTPKSAPPADPKDYPVKTQDAEEVKLVVPKEPPKPDAPPAKPKASDSTSEPKSTPREASRRELEAMKESEYVNDRSSAVEQRGEDVLDSARHKAAVWKSLNQALESDDAERMFTRDFLVRQEPIDLIAHTQKNPAHALKNLYLHLVQGKFPQRPSIHSVAKLQGATSARGSLYAVYYEGDKLTRAYTGAQLVDPPTEAEHLKKQRESFYKAYKAANDAIAEISTSSETNPVNVHDRIVSRLKDLHREFERSHGPYSAGTEALRQMANATIKHRKKTSPMGTLNAFARELNTRYPNEAERTREVSKYALAMMEGKGVHAAFGIKGAAKGKRKFDPASAYNTGVMHRKGPESEFRSIEQGLDMLDKGAGGKYGLRGVQWGKSVTDEERKHHLKAVVDSFADLTDLLGLPAGMASYNGKLALAIGARGKGNAAAHYEPGLNVINLTRAKGAGSLAHEWGHFFDFAVGKADGKGYVSLDPKKKPTATKGAMPGIGQLTMSRAQPEEGTVRRSVYDLANSEPMNRYKKRLANVIASWGIEGDEADYWTSRDEIFARCFERHVQRKLEKAGRANTYLVGIHKWACAEDSFWPTDAEVDAMAPHFDEIFERFRKSDLLHKALGVGPYAPAIDPLYAPLVGGILAIPRGA